MTNGRAIALGFFDGVHIGHAGLLEMTRLLADENGLSAAAMTFDTHPDTLVTGAPLPLINTRADRERLLRRAGMDEVLWLHFDRAAMEMPWEEFANDYLLGELSAKKVVCGHDFRFGWRGEGNAARLTEFCRAQGVECAVVRKIVLDGVTVSSTAIRAMIAGGDMARAVRFLGHPHILTGVVEKGRQFGRTMGIPTANIPIPDGLVVPAYGVYAARAIVAGRSRMAVVNVGVHPTVGAIPAPVAEAWLLDFDGDLYGETLELRFCAALRPEERFPSADALQKAIRRDAETVRHFFKNSEA